jgi:hypothetical protein
MMWVREYNSSILTSRQHTAALQPLAPAISTHQCRCHPRRCHRGAPPAQSHPWSEQASAASLDHEPSLDLHCRSTTASSLPPAAQRLAASAGSPRTIVFALTPTAPACPSAQPEHQRFFPSDAEPRSCPNCPRSKARRPAPTAERGRVALCPAPLRIQIRSCTKFSAAVLKLRSRGPRRQRRPEIHTVDP